MKIKKIFFHASWIIYGVSLLLPAVYFKINTELPSSAAEGPVMGLGMLMSGTWIWVPILNLISGDFANIGELVWLANLFFYAALILGATKKYKIGLMLSFIAILTAVQPLFPYYQGWAENPMIGFYFWLLSFISIFIFCLIGLIQSKINKPSNI